MFVVSVSLNISFREVIVFLFFWTYLDIYTFLSLFSFLTFYNVNIFTDHRFIPANLLILLIGLFSLSKDIIIIIIIIIMESLRLFSLNSVAFASVSLTHKLQLMSTSIKQP